MFTSEADFLVDARPLMDQYDKELNNVSKVITGLKDHEAATIAMLMDNAEKQVRKFAKAKSLSDQTYSEQVGPFIKHAMNIISVLYTTFDLSEIISIQPLRQKTGGLYFLNYQRVNEKGEVLANSPVFSPKQAPTRTGFYSSQEIKGESITLATGAGHTKWFPLVLTEWVEAQTITIGAVNYAFSSETSTEIIFKQVSGTETVTFTKATGAVVASAVAAAAATFTIGYAWDSEKYGASNGAGSTTQIPRIKISVDEEEVRATRRQLLFDISLDAIYDYESQFEKTLNADVEDRVIQEVQNELSFMVLDRMINECEGNAGKTYTISLDARDGVDLSQRAQDVAQRLNTMSTDLYKNYGRGYGNFIVAGAIMKNFFESLPSTIFESTGDNSDKNGPYKVGLFMKKFKVFFNPAFPDDEFIMGYKGSSWWEASYYIGSYLPLMASKFMMFPDMHGEQGYISMDAHKFLFKGHVSKGKVTFTF